MRITINNLYRDMLNKNHILIAGSTGCGKSTLIRSLLFTAMARNPAPEFILIDPKRVDLRKFKDLKLTKRRVTEMNDTLAVLNEIIDTMEERYKDMEARDLDITDKTDIYVVIDEVADLILDRGNGKQIESYIIKIAQLGRAAKVHLIMATQTVLKETCGTLIRNNFDCIVGMRTATAIQSRTIFGISGTEKLPEHGVAIVQMNGTIEMYKIEPTPDDNLNAMIDFWR